MSEISTRENARSNNNNNELVASPSTSSKMETSETTNNNTHFSEQDGANEMNGSLSSTNSSFPLPSTITAPSDTSIETTNGTKNSLYEYQNSNKTESPCTSSSSSSSSSNMEHTGSEHQTNGETTGKTHHHGKKSTTNEQDEAKLTPPTEETTTQADSKQISVGNSLVITARSKAKKPIKPDPKKQREKIKLIENKTPFKPGTTNVLISQAWWRAWKEYVNFSDDEHPKEKKKHKESHQHRKVNPPGPIDNSDLIDKIIIYRGFDTSHPYASEFTNLCRDGSVLFTLLLKKHIMGSQDYEIITEESYDLLSSWYGECNSNQKIVRKVIIDGLENNQMKRVEIHPFFLKLFMTNEQGKVLKDTQRIVLVSKKLTTRDLKLLGHILFDIERGSKQNAIKNCRLWSFLEGSPARCIADSDSQTLEKAKLVDGQNVVFEFRQPGGEYPLDSVEKNENSDESEEDEEEKRGKFSEIWDSIKDYSYSALGIATSATGKSKKKGLCGLRNLGNTCFMNSAIQCLSNTVPLKNYFLSGRYAKDINTSNVLGTKGKLANNFATLIKEMWSGGSVYSPVNFKYAISQFAPQFSGYNQHDSQELISYLLDGLHEDLNIVKDKPFIEMKDSDGRPDEVVAKEAWDQHLKRNNSVIVDLFQGQLKSTLICNICNKISVKFDPFMYLSVPVGKSMPFRMDVILMNTEGGSRATKYTVELPKQATVQVLATQFAKVSGRDPNKVMFFTMVGFSVGRALELNESVGVIDPNARSTPKVLCADIPDDYSEDKYLMIYIRQRYPNDGGDTLYKSVGIPFVLFVNREITTKEFYGILWDHLQRVAKKTPEDPESNIIPTPENEGEEYTNEQKLEILRNTVFPTFDPENIPFKFSVIDKSVEMVVNCGGIPILYNDEEDMVRKYLFEHEKYIFSVDWLDVSFLKTKETVTVHLQHSPVEQQHSKSGHITLDDCLKVNSEMEQLGQRDQWYCPRCKTHVCAFKQCCIWSSPEILIIHLKRFGYNRLGREKVTTFVDFPISSLDLSDYMVQAPEDHMLYDLFAISCHTGGLGGGHYYSYAKNCEDNKWYCFNDSSVSHVQEKEIKTSNAYLLFYQRKHDTNSREVNVEFQ